MGRRAWIVVVLLAVALVGTLPTGVAAGAADPGSASGDALASQERVAAQQDQEFQGLELRVYVESDGDAVWRYRYEYPIESEEDREAFEDYAEEFEREETEFYTQWRDQARDLTASWSEPLDRTMEAVDFDREADVAPEPTRQVGYVDLSYRWTNFARVEGDRLHVGDVFRGGFYLDEGQELILEPADGLAFVSTAPEPTTSGETLADSESVSWTGERTFTDRHPRATLAIQDGTAADDAGVSDGGDEGTGVLEPLLLGGGLALLLLALLAVAYLRGDLPEVGPLGDDGGGDETPTVATNGSAAAATESSPATDEPDPVEDPATLSDEDRVVALLEGREGRMKQSEIVDETEWSKSKVSMLLSDMEEEGTISKIQVGRENIIALEGAEPEAAGSPFDDNE